MKRRLVSGNLFLAGVFATAGLFSCQTQEDVLPQTEPNPVTEPTDPRGVTSFTDFTYVYQEAQYTEKEWADFMSANRRESEEFYGAMVGPYVLLYDSPNERNDFAEGIAQWAEDARKGDVMARSEGCTNLGLPPNFDPYYYLGQWLDCPNDPEYFLAFLYFYNGRNYNVDEGRLLLIASGTVYLNEEWWGWDLQDNVYQWNLPSMFKQKCSSYIWIYEELPFYNFAFCDYKDKYCADPQTKFLKLRVEAHPSVPGDSEYGDIYWTKDLYWNPYIGVSNKREEESDLSDNRMPPWFLPIYWEDRFESVRIEFQLQ